jgi:hypothetical protein
MSTSKAGMWFRISDIHVELRNAKVYHRQARGGRIKVCGGGAPASGKNRSERPSEAAKLVAISEFDPGNEPERTLKRSF